MGFYWYGYSNDITYFIKECGICHSENIIEKVQKIPKIIVSKGPHKRYQVDIWYLQTKLKKIVIIYIAQILQIILINGCAHTLKNKNSKINTGKN